MRYVSSANIKEGMVLAKPFYGHNFEILIGKGMTLSSHFIQRVVESGCPGLYIDDEISADIKVADIVPLDVRLKTIKAAMEILQRIEHDEFYTTKVTREQQEKITLPVISAVIDNPLRMVDMIDLKPYDGYNYYCAANVVILSVLVGVELGLTGTELHELGMASLLHDVGNIFIPKSILNKPGKLTPGEFEIIKTHSQMGFEYLREHFDISIETCMGALQHHENYNGTGYPNKLKKNKISIYGRIIAITNVYDSLTSNRPFRKAAFPVAAIEFMEACVGTMFDPDIFKALRRVVALYPTGCCVELDSGVRGIVAQNYHGHAERPKIKLLGNLSKEPVYVDLHTDPEFAENYVSKIIDM